MASTQLITDAKTAYSTGPSALTVANANAAAGVIMDVSGNIQGIIVGLTDVKRRITELLKDVDTTGPDPILTLLNGINQSLV